MPPARARGSQSEAPSGKLAGGSLCVWRKGKGRGRVPAAGECAAGTAGLGGSGKQPVPASTGPANSLFWQAKGPKPACAAGGLRAPAGGRMQRPGVRGRGGKGSLRPPGNGLCRWPGLRPYPEGKGAGGAGRPAAPGPGRGPKRSAEDRVDPGDGEEGDDFEIRHFKAEVHGVLPFLGL